MYLVSIAVENSTLVGRGVMDVALQTVALNAHFLSGRKVENLVSARASSDAVRVAVSYIVDMTPSVRFEDANCKFIRAEAKTQNAQEVRTDLHLRTKANAVNYPWVGYFTFIPGNGNVPSFTWNASLSQEVQDLIPSTLRHWLDNPAGLLDLGMDNLFSSDIRRVTAELLKGLPKLKKRSGDWLALGEKMRLEAKAVSQVLGMATSASPGKAGLEFFKGAADDQETKEGMARDLSSGYADRLQAVLSDLQKSYDSNKKAWAKALGEYEGLTNEAMNLETLLGCGFTQEYTAALGEVADYLQEIQDIEDAWAVLDL